MCYYVALTLNISPQVDKMGDERSYRPQARTLDSFKDLTCFLSHIPLNYSYSYIFMAVILLKLHVAVLH